MTARLLGGQPGSPFGLVEARPLDAHSRSVGHELEKLDVAVGEPHPLVAADQAQADQASLDDDGAAGQTDHAPRGDGSQVAIGGVVDDDRRPAAGDLSGQSVAELQRTRFGGQLFHSTRRLERQLSAIVSQQKDDRGSDAQDLLQTSQQFVEQLVKRQDGQRGIGEGRQRCQGLLVAMKQPGDLPTVGQISPADSEQQHRAGHHKGSATKCANWSGKGAADSGDEDELSAE